jgi:hypothetical protein
MARKKSYEILDETPGGLSEIDVDGRKVRFRPNGQAIVHDLGLAQEIDARWGHKSRDPKVLAIPIDDRDPTREADREGMRYSFTVPDLSRFKKKRKRP